MKTKANDGIAPVFRVITVIIRAGVIHFPARTTRYGHATIDFYRIIVFMAAAICLLSQERKQKQTMAFRQYFVCLL